VYDIGANVGFYTLLASMRVGCTGCVYAFEPLPRNLEYLRRHIGLNQIGNCEIIDAAVDHFDGCSLFDSSRPASMGRLSEKGQTRVRTVTLDSLVSRGEILPPHAMKIDVEGAEARVFEGSVETIRKHRPLIFLATHGPEVRKKCLEFLEGEQYRVEPLTQETISTDEEFLARP